MYLCSCTIESFTLLWKLFRCSAKPQIWLFFPNSINELPQDKTNKVAFAPSKDWDQPGHPPSLIRVFVVHSMGSSAPKFSSCGQRRLWSDWADAQADQSLRWAHMPFCWFCRKSAQVQYYWALMQDPLFEYKEYRQPSTIHRGYPASLQVFPPIPSFRLQTAW